MSEPSASPVRHSLCTRTSGGSPVGRRRSAARHARPCRRPRGRRRSRPARRSGWAAARARRCAGRRRVPNVMTSSAETRASAGPSRRVNRPAAGRPARARRSAARAVGGEQSGAVWNGPLSGVARSSAGSAMAVAASRSIQGARRISTGSVGSASRWLVSFSVAARLPEMSRLAARRRRRRRPAPRRRRSRWRGSETSSTATGQPRRSASIARATSRAPIRARIPSSAGHGPRAAPSCGRARRRCAPGQLRRRRRSPTYGRAAGRGRSSSSRASGSSTRCAAAAAPG